MPTPWDKINELETSERYPDAICALEERLRADPADKEAVIRLGFDYWLAIAEGSRLGLDVPREQYARRFVALLYSRLATMRDEADFCWAFGLGLSLSYFDFALDATDQGELAHLEELGRDLQQRAGQLDPCFERIATGAISHKRIAGHFAGRGSLANYYGVA